MVVWQGLALNAHLLQRLFRRAILALLTVVVGVADPALLSRAEGRVVCPLQHLALAWFHLK